MAGTAPPPSTRVHARQAHARAAARRTARGRSPRAVLRRRRRRKPHAARRAQDDAGETLGRRSAAGRWWARGGTSRRRRTAPHALGCSVEIASARRCHQSGRTTRSSPDVPFRPMRSGAVSTAVLGVRGLGAVRRANLCRGLLPQPPTLEIEMQESGAYMAGNTSVTCGQKWECDMWANIGV